MNCMHKLIIKVKNLVKVLPVDLFIKAKVVGDAIRIIMNINLEDECCSYE